MPSISTKELRSLARRLTPAEISVYLAAKSLAEEHKKLTKKAICNVLGKGTMPAIKSLMCKGVIPKGRITIEMFDAGVKRPHPTMVQHPNDGGKQLVSELAKNVKQLGGRCDGRWWGTQLRYCSGLVSRKDVTVDEWIRIIQWARARRMKYLVAAYQLPNLREKYHIAQKQKGNNVRHANNNTDLWEGII